MAYVVEPLRRDHDRAAFDCGVAPLNEYLVRYARQNEQRGFGRTYAAVPENENRVVGYYTLSAGAVVFAEVPDHLRHRFPRYPVPVVHLGRLATSRSVRGVGLGEALLVDALRRSLRVAEELGIVAVEVWAKSDQARAFYMKYGFTPLLNDSLHLYLPLATVREVLEA